MPGFAASQRNGWLIQWRERYVEWREWYIELMEGPVEFQFSLIELHARPIASGKCNSESVLPFIECKTY